jgi:hypothetical protein
VACGAFGCSAPVCKFGVVMTVNTLLFIGLQSYGDPFLATGRVRPTCGQGEGGLDVALFFAKLANYAVPNLQKY